MPLENPSDSESEASEDYESKYAHLLHELSLETKYQLMGKKPWEFISEITDSLKKLHKIQEGIYQLELKYLIAGTSEEEKCQLHQLFTTNKHQRTGTLDLLLKPKSDRQELRYQVSVSDYFLFASYTERQALVSVIKQEPQKRKYLLDYLKICEQVPMQTELQNLTRQLEVYCHEMSKILNFISKQTPILMSSFNNLNSKMNRELFGLRKTIQVIEKKLLDKSHHLQSAYALKPLHHYFQCDKSQAPQRMERDVMDDDWGQFIDIEDAPQSIVVFEFYRLEEMHLDNYFFYGEISYSLAQFAFYMSFFRSILDLKVLQYTQANPLDIEPLPLSYYRRTSP